MSTMRHVGARALTWWSRGFEWHVVALRYVEWQSILRTLWTQLPK